jgi:hypothetical protein
MQKQKIVTIKKAKIMSKNTKDKADKAWSISIGTYPGILFGMRTYHGDTHTQIVFYLPFFDVAYEVEN